MHTKKHLKPRGITILLIKSTGIMRFVPLIAIDLAALGLILLSAFGRMDSDSILSDLLLISQIFFPLFSVWWVIFILWGLIDADGSELIFTVCRKSLLRYILPPFLIMLANVSAITAVCAVILPAFAVEFLRILSVCVLYFGIAYFDKDWCALVPHSDSAEYKMWGNGMALPCMLYIMEGVQEILSRRFLSNLFDGKGDGGEI